MASPDTLEFERLLAPISAESPSGVELKDDAALLPRYIQAKDARENARTAERKLARPPDENEPASAAIAPPDWKKVATLTTDLLTQSSKDLWIAAWLLEAVTRLHGFAGLRDGFRLFRELAERYWDGIHPRPDEDGYATTLAQLTGLNGEDAQGTLLSPIDAIPITDSPAHGNLTSADHLAAVALEKVSDPQRRSQRIEQGAYTLEIFRKAANDTSADFFRRTLEDLDQAIAEFRLLNTFLDQKCGKDARGHSLAPPSSNLRNALTACRDRLANLAKEVLPAEGSAPASLAVVEGHSGGSQSLSVDASRMPTREEAFRSLLQVADFFRRTEPHSPVSYALEQAVRWGRMPLPELLQELIMDDGVRKELFRRTGIGPIDPAN